MLTKSRVTEILNALRDRNVVVLGDVMLDEFVWGDVTRISPEAPVPVVDVRRESVHLGGAANVLANLLALGAHGTVVGVVGTDEAGKRLRNGLRDLAASVHLDVMEDEPLGCAARRNRRGGQRDQDGDTGEAPCARGR